MGVIRAKDLRSADFGGTSDPYVELRVRDKHAGDNARSAFKSRIRKKTLNPNWFEQYAVRIENPNYTEFIVKVWDYDFGRRDDFLGELRFNMRETLTEWTNKPARKWYTLTGKKA